MNQQLNAALARKLSAGQEGAASNGRSILRAFRLALARAAAQRMNLPLAVIGAKQATRTPTDLNGVITDDWLLLVFASEHGAAGICLDPGFVSAIVQFQTIGDVTADPPETRSFTDTDTAMTIPLIKGFLAVAQTLVDGVEDLSSLSGLTFASRVPDVRSLGLALIDDSYRAYDLTAELAGGARQGRVCVLLPVLPDADRAAEVDSVAQGPCLEQAAGVIRAELHSVTCRISLPLARLSELQVGDVLPLTGARLDRTEVTTIDGTRTAIGRLGQCGGMRAVRINEQISLPALSDPTQHVFMENAPGPSATDTHIDVTPPQTDVATQRQSDPVIVDDPQIRPANSEQMVAEISQLAGLSDLDEES